MSYQGDRNGFPPGAHEQGDTAVVVEERRGSLAHVGGFGVTGTGVEGPNQLFDETVAQPADRSQEVFRLERDPKTYEVSVESDHGVDDYQAITNPEDWALLQHEAEALKGSKWVFINPTMEGGGVAMIRPPAVKLMKDLGVEAHWYVMEPIEDPADGDPFKFTKQMHNVSQRQSDERLTEEGKALHKQWADTENGPVLEAQEPIRNADFIVIDDPQPAPVIRRLKEANPNARFIWRNHIDTDHDLMADPSTPQGEVASYLLDELGVRDVDAVLAHPVPKFIHPGMENRTYFGPATADPFDNLNRHLGPEEVEEGIDFINEEIRAKNAELVAEGRPEDVQPLLDTDPERQRITLIARFDPSKGMDKAMEMGVQTRRKMRAQGVPEAELPEVVIVGNGSVDDPDGVPMLDAMLRLRRERYPDEADGIIVMRLKHNYDAMNALTSRSSIVMQTSDAEGLETRVSDAIQHGKPVVVSNRGGIKTQVIEGQSGLILDYDKPGHDLDRGSDFMSHLLTDPEAYAAMLASTKQAAAFNRREFTTTANVTRLLRIGNRLRQYPGGHADKVWKISDMVASRTKTAESGDFAAAA
ncbi:MAG TPA: glycosyltransferase [Candidatus Saccharimonadales bacterium]|nr:glycosyltransferase [Candidatus Saccharimonadales bacterium]